MCMPASKTGPFRKLSRPYKGPYWVVDTYPNGAEVHPIGKSRAEVIRVALERLRRCPEEIPQDNMNATDSTGVQDIPPVRSGLTSAQEDSDMTAQQAENADEDEAGAESSGVNSTAKPWRSRLRPRAISSRTT